MLGYFTILNFTFIYVVDINGRIFAVTSCSQKVKTFTKKFCLFSISDNEFFVTSSHLDFAAVIYFISRLIINKNAVRSNTLEEIIKLLLILTEDINNIVI